MTSTGNKKALDIDNYTTQNNFGNSRRIVKNSASTGNLLQPMVRPNTNQDVARKRFRNESE